MKKVIFTSILFVSIILSSASFSSEKFIDYNSSKVQTKRMEWVEYVLVGTQWYKITHLDSGENIIQASMGAGQD